MDNIYPSAPGCSNQCTIPLARLGSSRPISHHNSIPCCRNNILATEDDTNSFGRPKATIQPSHDAMDDSYYAWILFIAIPGRAVDVLDSFQSDRSRNTILHNWLAAFIPLIPKKSDSQPNDQQQHETKATIK